MIIKPETLRRQWIHLYQDRLPKLAKAKDPVQRSWPVHLDHCFARIILDNAIGVDRPWTEVVKKPAIDNMTPKRFELAITLAKQIAEGNADLVELNERSLELRGKSKKHPREDGDEPTKPAAPAKKQRRDGTVSSYFSPRAAKIPSQGDGLEMGSAAENEASREAAQAPINDDESALIAEQMQRIEDSDLTAFRKQTLTLLCQVPRGRYSTYQAMSDYITANSHKTCARAVGNAMRNNPFAPQVPCHRILAADGSLGGFKGEWGENGKYASKKRELLAEEGVKFDSRGKVKGPPFREFST